MIRIAIYNDDITSYMNNELIQATLYEQRVVAKVSEYQNKEFLLADMQEFEYFDLVFLSLEENQLQGITLAKKIKHVLPNCLIVFITSYMDYVFEAFEVPVYRFIIKNELCMRLKQVVEDAVSFILSKYSAMYLIEMKNHVEKILVKDIVYIKKCGRKSLIVTAYGQSSIRKNLNEIFIELEKYEFYYIDKGCIVNISYVMKMVNGLLEMKDGTHLSVSRSNRRNMMDILMLYWKSYVHIV